MDRVGRLRHGRPQRAYRLRRRSAALQRLRLRDGAGAHGDGAAQHSRHPRADRRRRPVRAGVQRRPGSRRAALMRVVHSGLAGLGPGLPDPATCGEALTRASLKLETLERAGDELAGIVVGEGLDIEERRGFKKPIRYVHVRTGGADPRGIVCGATNFAVGDRVPVALPGAVLPGSGGRPGSTITARTTYGHVSEGMICSARELGIGDDHRGILVLGEDTPVGVEFAELIGLPDSVLDLEITSDRGYALSHRGVARELGTAFDLTFTDPADVVLPELAPGYEVRIDDPSGCSRYVAREVSGLDATVAVPTKLASRLALAGMRSIS